MLIIAIPKSASTSLLHTLGDVHSLPSTQDFKSVKHHKIPEGFQYLGKYHSDVRELNETIIKKWTEEMSFYKQHIPPTENNLSLLKDEKKVILLRNPKEIVLAYKRADDKDIHEKREEFEGCFTERDWLKRANEIGLYEELNLFYSKWGKVSSNALVIDFEDLTSKEKETINLIENYFGLELSRGDLELKKYRYSQHSTFLRYMYRLREKTKKIFLS